MSTKQTLMLSAIGIVAGTVTGIFGGGGGMILVPLLTLLPEMKQENVFPASVSIILPICVVSIAMAASDTTISFYQITPYLLGSLLGGIAAGIWGRKIPVCWLHRILGALILWGGIRFLWQTTS